MNKNERFAGLFLIIVAIIFVGVAVYSAPVVIPQTGQTICYSSTGATVPCDGTGQDGDTTKPGGIIGEAWPTSRFTVGTDTITDNLTGLMWFKTGATPTIGSCVGGQKNWTNALEYVACLNTTAAGAPGAYGYNDWRLPNVNELRSLMPSEQGGGAAWLMSQGWSTIGNTSGTNIWYWASTTYVSTLYKAWAVNFKEQHVAEGLIGPADRIKSTKTLYVLPVRGGTL